MRVRLAKKIVETTWKFKNVESNYQPYGANQQKKAFKISARRCSLETKRCLYIFGAIKKVPLKYKKYKGFLPVDFVW